MSVEGWSDWAAWWESYREWAIPSGRLDAGEVHTHFELLVPGGHHVAKLLGDPALLDDTVRAARELPSIDHRVGGEQALAEAADRFVDRLNDVTSTLADELADLSDAAYAALRALEGEDQSAAAGLRGWLEVVTHHQPQRWLRL